MCCVDGQVTDKSLNASDKDWCNTGQVLGYLGLGSSGTGPQYLWYLPDGHRFHSQQCVLKVV